MRTQLRTCLRQSFKLCNHDSCQSSHLHIHLLHILCSGAKKQKLRRICEVKPSGKCHVPEHIHKQSLKGGTERDDLLAVLENCGWSRALPARVENSATFLSLSLSRSLALARSLSLSLSLSLSGGVRYSLHVYIYIHIFFVGPTVFGLCLCRFCQEKFVSKVSKKVHEKLNRRSSKKRRRWPTKETMKTSLGWSKCLAE